jgi:hypothetical protein
MYGHCASYVFLVSSAETSQIVTRRACSSVHAVNTKRLNRVLWNFVLCVSIRSYRRMWTLMRVAVISHLPLHERLIDTNTVGFSNTWTPRVINLSFVKPKNIGLFNDTNVREWLRRFIAGLSPRKPGTWDLWWTLWHWDRIFFSFSLLLSYHRVSILIYHLADDQ